MSTINNLSIHEMSIIITLLNPHQRNLFEQLIQQFTRDDNNINALLNPEQQSTRLASRSNKGLAIVDWKLGEMMSFTKLAELTGILRILGYKLLPIETVTKPCHCCDSKTCISLSYACENDYNDSYDYQMCMSCYMAVKLIPVYGEDV